MKWKDIKKIDAHVHILPKNRRDGFIKYYGEDDIWGNASVEEYIKIMDKNNIEKAILLPTNDRYMYYDMRKTNEFLSNIIKRYPDRFMAFSDLNIEGSYIFDKAVNELEYAIKELGLIGLKIHPSNLNMDADDYSFIPILRKAAEIKIPIIYHGNPCFMGFNENAAPDKINKVIKVFPDIDIITAHMGGMKYLDSLSGGTYVDISYILPEFIKLYGYEQTERILKAFGSKRLIFGTDYPETSIEEYMNILDRMNFTKEEMEDIAYKNIEKILDI